VVRVVENLTRDPFICAARFPDAYQVSLLCPVPARRLLDLVRLFDALEADADVAGEVLMCVVKTPSRVEYVRDRCHDIPHDLAQFAAYSERGRAFPLKYYKYLFRADRSIRISFSGEVLGIFEDTPTQASFTIEGQAYGLTPRTREDDQSDS